MQSAEKAPKERDFSVLQVPIAWKKMATPPLTLPACELRTTVQDGMTKVFDVLRQRYVALTPEEWVRQHFVHFLIGEKGFSQALMGNEVQLTLNGMSRRCDTVVYDRQLRPRMIVEYKRPDVSITQKVFDQIGRYNMVMRVDWLIVSNGLEHYCCRMDYEQQTYAFVREIPTFEKVVGEKPEDASTNKCEKLP